ncbi:tetratricopeptide repeat protein [Streptomyces vietnamensis]|uniref:tetratricopeptide repeat protein n=1 Tax=Streptomyces vietnamensis TaxID=362257 RepID=UPI00131E0532|nr:tetratricopeptide repeat protein [Streptomyces vietnamensis]
MAAGGNISGSVTQHIENATLLPAEAYGPLPADAADGGITNVPRMELFVGRDRELDALDAALSAAASPGGVVLRAVSGLGGVGKSALAARWAASRSAARLRWWITADSAASVDAGLAALARALQPGLGDLPADVQKERALAWLARHPDWLIVLDNVDHPDRVRPLLDRATGGGRFLITTRWATGWHQLATPIQLDVFTPRDAHDLFTRVLTHTGPRDTTAVEEVCAELGHLALAVEQAAAYCHENGTTADAYLTMLRQWPADTLATGPAAGDADRTIARIWRVTLDRLADLPTTGETLRLLAWYAPDRIPRTLLDGLAPPPVIATAVGRLAAHSMITTHQDGTLSVHRLVQAVARTPDAGDPHRQPDDIAVARLRAAAGLDRAVPEDPVAPQNRPLFQALVPHIRTLGPVDVETAGVDVVRRFDRASIFLLEDGVREEAAEFAREALGSRERSLGEKHPLTLVSRNTLARIRLASGDAAGAIELHTAVLADRVRVLGEDHPDTLTSRNNLARCYEEAGDAEKAIELHTAVLADRIRVLGDTAQSTLTSRNNLANAYHRAGRPEHAVPLLERTVADLVRVVGRDHSLTLTSRANLALAYLSLGDLQRAVLLLEESLAETLRVLGENHPRVVLLRTRLAEVHQETDEPSKAIPLLRALFAHHFRRSGRDHAKTLAAQLDLANAHQFVHLDLHIFMLRGCLAEAVRALGKDHPIALSARNNLAAALHRAHDFGSAVVLLEEAVADHARVLSDEHPRTKICRENLAKARADLLERTQSVPPHEKALADRVRDLGEDHPDTVTARYALASAYSSAGRHDQIVDLLAERLAHLVESRGEDHPETLTARHYLARTWLTSGHPHRALPLFEENLDRATGAATIDVQFIGMTRYFLAYAYFAAGHMGRAAHDLEQYLAACREALDGAEDDHFTEKLRYAWEQARFWCDLLDDPPDSAEDGRRRYG